MEQSFKIGDTIHKKADDRNRTGKIKEFREGKAYCEFNVLKINDQNHLGVPLAPHKTIPIDKIITEFETVPLDELEYPKENGD